MGRKLVILIFCVCCVSFAIGQNFDYHRDFVKMVIETKDKNSLLNYNTLIRRFEVRDTSLNNKEVLAMLIGFTQNPNYLPYVYYESEQKIRRLNQKGKHRKALELSEYFLQQVPVSQSAIIERSYAYYKLGMRDSARVYLWKFEKIMTAMLSSGDGVSPETAFFALGPTDGHNFVAKYLGGEVGELTSAHDDHNNFIDVVEFIYLDEESGELQSKKLYFHIQHAVARMFQEKK